ncbi:aconitase iron-sulfur domain-containing protein [Periconia macrospinosa]|uniref:Aconitase iron-sulfur domain-containing protein n=1 Tax=Periconia macrospinosa TaxID=97972 RepID=A0A2V1DWK4_9PLEO|nr:aconitase iron-sulfur domain-containing protein [Periconia macrospinosa]
MPANLDEISPKEFPLVKALSEIRSLDLYGKDILHRIDMIGHSREADALLEAYQHCKADPDFGGLGLSDSNVLNESQSNELLFYVSAYLEALNYQDRNATPRTPLRERPFGRRGMTLAEKIFAAHDVSGQGEVKPGDVIRLDVDWVIASELSWSAMEKTYESLGSPGIFRNDRLWIAGDHVVDPRVMDHPKIKPLIDASERAKRIFKMTENQGMNYTIMHTEFCRERAQPGMLVIGSDSHTCSAGSVSCLAIGLGVADVTLPLVTGETWIKVPETVEIRFINEPRLGIGGKDVILYILKELKRNTVAADRVVEYTGPGLKSLSCDARFAICNMATEFGAVTGICVPDDITKSFIDKRKNPKHKKLAHYYRPDTDAQYAESHIIDLHKVEPSVARYPSPDDVVPVESVAGTALDGCFIGACTTAREDLVLAALVLEAGLDQGLKPADHGKRKVVPGSRPILHDLRKLSFVDIFERAGFEIGVPSCSYCVGMSADKAGKGEVWLSSQNRNFENRMGPGAIGSITSAVTVAASSFDMKITDPTPLIDRIDHDRLQELLGIDFSMKSIIQYVEPSARNVITVASGKRSNPGRPEPHQSDEQALTQDFNHKSINGKVQTLGDFIDTDALAPAKALIGNLSAAELGEYCLCHTHPSFRQRVKDGLSVVVAGKAFGVGSSRENAVTALMGTGVQCVIARSFAFIYSRNQPNLGLLGIVMEDERFYEVAIDGADIEIGVEERVVRVGGREFPFTLSDLEMRLWKQGGMSPAFAKWGKEILERVTAPSKKVNAPARLERSVEEQKFVW